MAIGSQAVPLTRFQAGVAKLVAGNRSPDSYLAGGAALHLQPRTKRYSNDLDYFHDSEERVASAFRDDREALVRAGYTIDVTLQHPGFVRAIVGLGGESTKVEWAHDSAWRFLPPLQDPLAGYVLHPVDLAINKVMALVGRDEPRDFLDVLHAHETILPLGGLLWAAAGKDPGFTPTLLLSLARRRGKYRPEDFAALHLTAPVDLQAMKRVWLEALDQADDFIQSRSPDDIGCLFYDVSKERFVGTKETAAGKAVKPHHGRPGGVLPLIA
jgi:hypothetical protein